MAAVIQIQLQEFLNMLGDAQTIQAELADGHESDEEDGFVANQRKGDDYEQFSKLLRTQVENSLALILQNLQELVMRYRLVLGQIFEGKDAPESVTKIALERQMGFLIAIINCMFSYGLPTSSGKLKVKFVEGIQAPNQLIRNRYDDFSVCGCIIQLIGDLSKALELPQGRMADVELELAMLNFILTFRSSVIGDPKLIMFGRTTRTDAVNDA